jgi:cell division septum initiation protein DivIVA
VSSKIEQIIEEIEEYINSCKYQPLSNTKIVVNKEEIDELLTELRLKTPDEIKRYQKIINNKEAILADAQAKADAIIAQATVHTNELINEHEIMQQAYAQANEIVQIATNQAQDILDKATIDANNIRYGAIQYTDDMLANLQGIISHTINTSTAKYDNLMKSLQDSYDIVNSNRVELAPQEEEEVQEIQEDVTEQEYEE